MKPRSSWFKPGHKKVPGSGRPSGVENTRGAKGIREILRKLLTPEELHDQWQIFLHSPNKELRFDAFKLALFYLYGRPPREPIEAEDRATGVTGGPAFDTDAMPTRDERLN